ncbi:hypothetical protein IWQ61_006232 [Dispira simplex]|nr:hypothetical protein IWQ61_006232 [Dispira simplex]
MLLDDVIPPIAPKVVYKAPVTDRILPFHNGNEHIPGTIRHILETNPDATTLYYGAIHYQFPNKHPDTPLNGLVKWYLRDLAELSGTDPLQVAKSEPTEPSIWEVQSVDKLAGPIAHVALDRSDPARVQLAILYYQNKGEVLQFFIRIYHLYKQWDDYPLQQYPPCPEWKPSVTVHASYEAEEFHQCANVPPLQWTDYEFPGSTWVTAFQLRQQQVIYSRANDVVKFRTIRIPKMREVVTPSDTETALPVLHSSPGPRINSVQTYPEMQLNLAVLPNAKPLDSLHLLFARVWHDTDRYRFQLARFENRTVPTKGDPIPQSTSSLLSSTSKTDWVHSHVIRYSLMTGGEYNPLSDKEMRLLRKKPVIIQAPMSTVVYFPLVDVILTLDQVLESEAISKNAHNSNIEAISSHYIESLVLRTRRIMPLDASENLNVYSMFLDQFATVLVVVTLENDILVYQRSHSSSTHGPSQATGYAMRDYRTWVTEHFTGTQDRTSFESHSEQPLQVAPMLTRFRRINDTAMDNMNWRRTHAWTLGHTIAPNTDGGDVNPSHPPMLVQESFQAMLVVTSYPTVQPASYPETPPADPPSPNPALRVKPRTFLWTMLSDGTLVGWDLNTMRSTTLISRFIRNQPHMVLGVLLVIVTFVWNELQFH